jgi:hypothetical protein
LNICSRLGCVILGTSLLMAQSAVAQGTTNTSGSTSGGSGSTSGGSGSSSSTTRQISLHIPDESAPPGGVVQMKFLVTEPTPITSGGPRVPVPSDMAVDGIQLFNPNGDVSGVAMVGPSLVSIASITSTGTQGSDYPIMTIALQLPASISSGSKLSFGLDPSSTWALGLLGTATLKPFPPATITVGGSISITDVVPGGGVLPAGAVVSVRGIGFQNGTQVQLSNVKASSISVVSPQEIQIVLAEPTQMTGKKIQVTNPDGSRDTYFSYMRGIPLGQSNRTLLATAVPIFSSETHSQAVFAVADSLSASEFTGIAVQNPSLLSATVTFTLFSASNAPLGSSTVVIPSGYRMMRETSELAGVVPPPGSYLVVSSDTPIQTFGFLGDSVSGTVFPFVALSSQP